MNRPHIGVVGGGLAGLSAAIACGDAGARVTLFESRVRLGGATWSTRQGELWIDNGQHIFLRCCEAYLGFLRRLGVEDQIDLQKRLDIPVLMPGAPPVSLKRSNLRAPFHMTSSLLRFTHLGIGDRLRVARAALALRGLDLDDPALDAQSFGDWLNVHRQSPQAIDRFWDLLIRATLNIPAREASLALATKIFQTGLLTDSAAGDIGFSRVPLSQLHADPAARVLEDLGAQVLTRSPVTAVECSEHRAPGVRWGGQRQIFDAVIVATPHDSAAKLLPDEAGVDKSALRSLGSSPIVNLHVVYDRRVTELAFAAGVNTPLQWIFDRTRGAGLEKGQYLAVSLSAAQPYVGKSRGELRAIFEPELERLFPAARSARIQSFFATCEREATFRQAPGSAAKRPGVETRAPGIFLAGAWTDTGWPATMEGAVRSGNAAAHAALVSVGVSQGPREAAAA